MFSSMLTRISVSHFFLISFVYLSYYYMIIYFSNSQLCLNFLVLFIHFLLKFYLFLFSLIVFHDLYSLLLYETAFFNIEFFLSLNIGNNFLIYVAHSHCIFLYISNIYSTLSIFLYTLCIFNAI